MIRQIKLQELYLYQSSTETSIIKFTKYTREKYVFKMLENRRWITSKVDKAIAEVWKQYLHELTDEIKLELL